MVNENNNVTQFSIPGGEKKFKCQSNLEIQSTIHNKSVPQV